MKGRTYAEAQDLLDQYYDAEAPEIISTIATTPSSSSTTQVLLQEIKNSGMNESALESDDTFLKNVLIRNKNRFTGYAKTAAKIYFEQKQCLQERLIRNSIDESVNGIVAADNADADLSSEDYNAVIYRLLNTLNAFSADHDEFNPLLSLLETDNTTASQIWDDIMELFDQEAFKDPCDKGAFLDQMMPIDAMLREVMHNTLSIIPSRSEWICTIDLPHIRRTFCWLNYTSKIENVGFEPVYAPLRSAQSRGPPDLVGPLRPRRSVLPLHHILNTTPTGP